MLYITHNTHGYKYGTCFNIRSNGQTVADGPSVTRKYRVIRRMHPTLPPQLQVLVERSWYPGQELQCPGPQLPLQNINRSSVLTLHAQHACMPG